MALSVSKHAFHWHISVLRQMAIKFGSDSGENLVKKIVPAVTPTSVLDRRIRYIHNQEEAARKKEKVRLQLWRELC